MNDVDNSGLKTSEFYGKTFVQLMLMINMMFGLNIAITPEQSMAMVAGLEAIYTLGRSLVKAFGGVKTASVGSTTNNIAAPASGPSSGA